MSDPKNQDDKTLKIDKLNQMFKDADEADNELFSEQRSNVLLIAGEHYTRRNAKYWNRIRDSKDLSSEQKLRLTKNHIQKITKTYVNNIISHSPSVKVVPANQKELKDQKSAQLNDSVLQYAKNKQDFKKKTLQLAKDYIDIGEVAVKIFWNPNAGKFLGWEASMDEETGQPIYGEDGQYENSGRPKFSGELQIERLYGFNLLRSTSCKSMEESPFFIVRKMVPVDELKAMVAGDEDKEKMITEQKDDTFLIFDGNHQNYTKSEGQTMLREFYFKPSMDYPTGYYYITVEGGILFEGELPFGIFPIIYEGFDEIQTSPRHRSIVKQLRPYQAELNRAASKIAEHQVTLGDDKILTQSGTKITTGIHLPGVRSIQYSGMQPTILPGRSGEQYVNYMNSQIQEMYQVANLSEDTQEKQGIADPFAQLFQSVRDKKKFTIYTDKFEGFLCKVFGTWLDLARRYMPEDMVIPMIGSSEAVNISEFKTTEELSYRITVEPMVDDYTTMMGRQLTINHILQYVGPQMKSEDIGKLIRAAPFGNLEEAFGDMTLDYDTATNMILSLDRGAPATANHYDDEQYMIKRLIARKRQSDYSMMNPQIQQNYDAIISQYEDIAAQKAQQLIAAQNQFIPSGGARIKVDYYVPDPVNPDRPVRATLPAESVDWLIKRLADQGSSQEQMAQMNQGAVQDIAGKLNQQQGANAQIGAQPGGAPMPPRPGPQMPMARPPMPAPAGPPASMSNLNQPMPGRRMP